MAVKRVLMVHNYYQQGGGEHTVFKNEVRMLRQNGVEVFTYTRDNADLKRRPWKLLLLPFSTIWSFSSYHAVKCLVREKQIDLVHCHNTFPQISPSVYYAAWSCGVPVVQTVHNFRFICPNGLCFRQGRVCEECLQGGLKKALAHGCYRGSSIQTLPVVLMLAIHRKLGTYRKIPCIFLTEFCRQKIAAFLDMPASNIFVRGNFVENGNCRAAATEKNKFVYAGRLDSYKGVVWMLERFSRRSDLHLVVFGDGKLMDVAQDFASRCPNIELRGQCSREEVAQELNSAEALVLPSLLYEGFPMIIAESFACGVPVLCSNIGNGAQLVRQTEGGVLCEPESEASFEHAMQMLRQNRETFAANARRAAEQWGGGSSWQRLKTIYEEIMRNGGRTG